MLVTLLIPYGSSKSAVTIAPLGYIVLWKLSCTMHWLMSCMHYGAIQHLSGCCCGSAAAALQFRLSLSQCSGWAVNQLLLAPWLAVVCLVHLFVLCYFIGGQKDIWVVILDIQYPAAMLSTRWRWIQESIYQSQVFLYRVKEEENYR